MTARCHREAAPAIARNVNAKARHHRQRDLNVRFGDQLAHHFNFHGLSGQRQRHQQAG